MTPLPPSNSSKELADLLKQTPSTQRILGKVTSSMEGVEGLSRVKFFQGLMVALLPKLVVARSFIEATENTFLELLEAATAYFALPMLGNQLMKGFHKLGNLSHVSPENRFDRNLLGKSVKTLDSLVKEGLLSPNKLPHVLSAKLAILLTTFGLIVAGGEYMANYAKNWMTVRVFKKDSFSDIVNLSKGSIQTNHPSKVEAKALRRMKQCLVACAATVGTGLGIALMGHRLPMNAMKKVLNTFDFEFSDVGKLCLSRPQMLTYLALAFPAYMDAARDKLEKVEVFSRLTLVMGYIGFGQELLQKGLMNRFAKQPKETLSIPVLTMDKGGTRGRLLTEVASDAMRQAREKLGKTATEKEVLEKAGTLFVRPLDAKIQLFGIPLAVGVLGTGVGAGFLNRFWTSYRYKASEVPNRPDPVLPVGASPIPVGMESNYATFPMGRTPMATPVRYPFPATSPVLPVRQPLPQPYAAYTPAFFPANLNAGLTGSPMTPNVPSSFAAFPVPQSPLSFEPVRGTVVAPQQAVRPVYPRTPQWAAPSLSI